eukprot:89732-Amphidinium_carterae.1
MQKSVGLMCSACGQMCRAHAEADSKSIWSELQHWRNLRLHRQLDMIVVSSSCNVLSGLSNRITLSSNNFIATC